MLCIVYVLALSAGLGVVGLLLERALPPAWSRRWIWCGVIAISLAAPGIQRTHHPIDVGAALQARGATAMDRHARPAPMWPDAITAFDPVVNRVWAVASAGLLAWGLLGAAWLARVSRRARRPSPARLRSEAPAPRGPTVVDGVPVVVTDQIGPATVGLLRSHVLLPRWVLAMPAAQRRYVVQHEEEHRRAHDVRLLGLASLALVVTPWNVALWWHVRQLHLAVESDCDRRVVRALGDPRAYGALLLHVADAMSRGPHLQPMLQPALLGRVGTLERRLTALLRPTARTGTRQLLLPLVACALLAALLALPHPVAGHSSAHHAGMRAVARAERP